VERPRLIASDVDGTLLGLDERVSERTAAVIGRALADDTPFVLVTGRPPRWVTRVAQDAGTDGFAVCANGAVLYDIGAGRVVWERTLEPAVLASVGRALDHALPGCALAVDRLDDGDGPTFLAEPAYRHAWLGDGPAAVGRAEMFGRPALKLLVRHQRMTSAAMAEAAAAVLGDDVTVTYSTDLGLIEVAARGVTKADGLADVAARFGVPAADVVAFGDMPNDVSMLAWAGHGVAMENAHPLVIEVADEVTTPHTQDGVALVLERWF
jgi:hydroxymethylpyrimidine pyrophosphatase-like HAD family hydrolase